MKYALFKYFSNVNCIFLIKKQIRIIIIGIILPIICHLFLYFYRLN
jgi:hypothetical protein